MMKARKLFILFFVSYGLLGCHSQTRPSNSDSAANPRLYYPRKDDLNISIVKLLAYPERYDGRTVRVTGYLHLEFEGDALYLHREDYEASISKNGIWINITSDGAAL